MGRHVCLNYFFSISRFFYMRWIYHWFSLCFVVSIHLLSLSDSSRRLHRRGNSRVMCCSKYRVYNISIHSPHEGRYKNGWPAGSGTKISIHPPHVGRYAGCFVGLLYRCISIHPPHEGRYLYNCREPLYDLPISIHPPRAGRYQY